MAEALDEPFFSAKESFSIPYSTPEILESKGDQVSTHDVAMDQKTSISAVEKADSGHPGSPTASLQQGPPFFHWCHHFLSQMLFPHRSPLLAPLTAHVGHRPLRWSPE